MVTVSFDSAGTYLEASMTALFRCWVIVLLPNMAFNGSSSIAEVSIIKAASVLEAIIFPGNRFFYQDVSRLYRALEHVQAGLYQRFLCQYPLPLLDKFVSVVLKFFDFHISPLCVQ